MLTPEQESRMRCTVRDLELENVRLKNEVDWARKALADVHSGRIYTKLLKSIDYWRKKRDEALGVEPVERTVKFCPKCAGYEKGCEECRWTGLFSVWLEESGRDFEAEQLRQDV